MSAATKTLKLRVKDRHSKYLSTLAVDVNQVWNYLNELSSRSIKERGKFLSAYDMEKYLTGATQYFALGASSINKVAHEYATRRKQTKKSRLRWRKSFGSRRSLGWIPIRTGCARWHNGQVKYLGKYFKVWDSYGLSAYKFRSASFSEDTRGRWYFNVVVEVPRLESQGKHATGIDLGCKEAATCSDATKLTGRWYRELEKKLTVTQRANNKKRAKAIHAKAVNRRKDALHKFSRKLVDENAAIFVGNVNAKAIAKTRMAKSSLDAGWGMLKTMLEYKCDHAGIVFEEINEAYTTQACSSCGEISPSSPKGMDGLGIREWTCAGCGASHDRDVNAAKNILALGCGRLAGESFSKSAPKL